jgi:hypothetical protein
LNLRLGRRQSGDGKLCRDARGGERKDDGEDDKIGGTHAPPLPGAGLTPHLCMGSARGPFHLTHPKHIPDLEAANAHVEARKKSPENTFADAGRDSGFHSPAGLHLRAEEPVASGGVFIRRGREEAVMEERNDRPDFMLLRTVDEKLRRAELILEQQQLHILHLHPTRRGTAERELRRLFNEYQRLRAYRQCELAATTAQLN